MKHTVPIRKLQLLSLIVVCMFLVVGCAKWTTKKYDYKVAVAKYSWGRVEGKLAGTYHVTENDVQFLGAPYDLLLSVYTDRISTGTVRTENIEITNVDTGKSVPIVASVLETKISSTDNIPNHAYLGIENLQLKYGRYTAIFDVSVISGNIVIREKVGLVFEKNYSERKSNKYWDILMGV